MKKRVQKSNSIATKDTVELKRWCIEMAMRWPISSGRSGMHGVAIGGLPPQYVAECDHDVIGRAEKLLQWVTK